MTTRHASINPYPVWLRLALTSTFLLWAVWAPDAIRLAAGALLAQATRPIFRCPWLGWRREIGFAAFGGLLVALMALPHMDLARLAPFTAMAILRFHLSLTPGLWFSSTLNSRELTYACRRLPPFIALSLELAFRFLPLLGREFCDIYALQKVRGAWRH
ncbi:MAG TPA: CbiQ family ECF transporter T component, partial [Candidatus Ozemobacteraceae bacterium]|nr:CbiQ family ECF transporter T component [Candidatus Ozemobacteraceae bacterium]